MTDGPSGPTRTNEGARRHGEHRQRDRPGVPDHRLGLARPPCSWTSGPSGACRATWSPPSSKRSARRRARRLKVAKLNIDDNPEATRTYGVMSIPSLILFKGGQEVARVVGARPKDAILRDLEPHLG